MFVIVIVSGLIEFKRKLTIEMHHASRKRVTDRIWGENEMLNGPEAIGVVEVELGDSCTTSASSLVHVIDLAGHNTPGLLCRQLEVRVHILHKNKVTCKILFKGNNENFGRW